MDENARRWVVKLHGKYLVSGPTRDEWTASQIYASRFTREEEAGDTMWVKTSNSFGPQWFNIGRTADPIGKARREIEQLNRDCGSPSWGPEFEIVESPPPDVIRRLIDRVDGQIAGLRGYQEHLRRELEKAERATREVGR